VIGKPKGVSSAEWQRLVGAVEEYRDAVSEHRASVDAGDRLGGIAEPSELAEGVANLCVKLFLNAST
jgi:hypothetical protein